MDQVENEKRRTGKAHFIRSAAALALVAGFYGATTSQHTAFGAATVTVDATQQGATVSAVASGMNVAMWDGHMQDSAVPTQLQSAGMKLVRFPGGSYGDIYHWQTNTLTPGASGYIAPGNNFDNFMQNVVKPAGANAIVIANYGTNSSTGGGDPNEAAAWVQHANVTNNDNVKYWEIGNEVYGNGYYGSDWEADNHSSATGNARIADPNLSPSAYAANAQQYASAMKAVDPSIKIGLVLASPTDWFGTTTTASNGVAVQPWNATVLQNACQIADFVAVHWYAQGPGSETDSGLLADPSNIASIVSGLHNEFSQYCGTHVPQILVTETNSVSYNPGKQTTNLVNGLFAIENEMSWFQNGVQSVDWWDLHNGVEVNNTQLNASLYGSNGYGDYGALALGNNTTINGVTYTEPTANTPFASFTGLQLLQPAIASGSTFVSANSSISALHTWATTQPNGQLSLVVVNSDPTNSYALNPSFTGFTPSAATVTSMGSTQSGSSTSTLAVQNGSVSYTLPPYSAAVFQFQPGTGANPTATPTETSVPTTATSTATGTSVPPTATSTPTSTSVPPTATSTPTATPVPPTATPTSTTGTISATNVMGNFENTYDGFQHDAGVTAWSPSTWKSAVALGHYAISTQYSIPTVGATAQISKSVNLDLSGDNYLSASLYPYSKSRMCTTTFQVQLRVQGSDGVWYASPAQTMTCNARQTIKWSIASVPRAPLKQVAVQWGLSDSATTTSGQMYVDAVQATTS